MAASVDRCSMFCLCWMYSPSCQSKLLVRANFQGNYKTPFWFWYLLSGWSVHQYLESSTSSVQHPWNFQLNAQISSHDPVFCCLTQIFLFTEKQCQTEHWRVRVSGTNWGFCQNVDQEIEKVITFSNTFSHLLSNNLKSITESDLLIFSNSHPKRRQSKVITTILPITSEHTQITGSF